MALSYWIGLRLLAPCPWTLHLPFSASIPPTQPIETPKSSIARPLISSRETSKGTIKPCNSRQRKELPTVQMATSRAPADLTTLRAQVHALEAQKAEQTQQYAKAKSSSSPSVLAPEQIDAPSTFTPSSTSSPIVMSSVAAHTRLHLPNIASRLSDSEAAAIFSDVQSTIKTHIRLLHDYNAVKDVAQGLMGILAERKGVRLVDVMAEFDAGDE